MDEQECYEWAKIFTAPWESLVNAMAQRAKAMGLLQKEIDAGLVWFRDDQEHCRWLFIGDPSNIQAVRDVFNGDENANSPSCYVVVKQPDPSDDRGDIISEDLSDNGDRHARGKFDSTTYRRHAS